MRHFAPLVFLLALACVVTRATELPPLSLRVTPRASTPPLPEIRIEALVPRDAANRSLCIAVDGPSGESVSCEQVDGDRAPAIYVRHVFHLDLAGEYVVTASLYRGGKQAYRVVQTRVQVGSLPDED